MSNYDFFFRRMMRMMQPDDFSWRWMWLVVMKGRFCACLVIIITHYSLTFGRACSRSANLKRAWLCSHLIAAFLITNSASAQTRQHWRDSLEVLNAKIGRDPNNLDLHLLKAEANINLEQWDYALAEYGKILHVDEKNLAALYFRAFVHTQQHHLDLARVDYESFLRLQPQHFEARLGLAHVLQKMGRKSDTTDELNRLVQMFPDSADAYAARAAYETEQKLYDIALYDWDEAIRRKPLNEGFVVSKADILITLYRMDEARKELEAAIKRGIPRYALKEWLDKCK